MGKNRKRNRLDILRHYEFTTADHGIALGCADKGKSSTGTDSACNFRGVSGGLDDVHHVVKQIRMDIDFPALLLQ